MIGLTWQKVKNWNAIRGRFSGFLVNLCSRPGVVGLLVCSPWKSVLGQGTMCGLLNH